MYRLEGGAPFPEVVKRARSTTMTSPPSPPGRVPVLPERARSPRGSGHVPARYASDPSGSGAGDLIRGTSPPCRRDCRPLRCAPGHPPSRHEVARVGEPPVFVTSRGIESMSTWSRSPAPPVSIRSLAPSGTTEGPRASPGEQLHRLVCRVSTEAEHLGEAHTGREVRGPRAHPRAKRRGARPGGGDHREVGSRRPFLTRLGVRPPRRLPSLTASSPRGEKRICGLPQFAPCASGCAAGARERDVGAGEPLASASLGSPEDIGDEARAPPCGAAPDSRAGPRRLGAQEEPEAGAPAEARHGQWSRGSSSMTRERLLELEVGLVGDADVSIAPRPSPRRAWR